MSDLTPYQKEMILAITNIQAGNTSDLMRSNIKGLEEIIDSTKNSFEEYTSPEAMIIKKSLFNTIEFFITLMKSNFQSMEMISQNLKRIIPD